MCVRVSVCARVHAMRKFGPRAARCCRNTGAVSLVAADNVRKRLNSGELTTYGIPVLSRIH